MGEPEAVAVEATPAVDVEALQKEIATLKFENAEKRVARDKALQEVADNKATQDAAALAAKEKNGEFEVLYNDLKANSDKTATTSTAKIEKLQGVVEKLLETELKAIPEAFRALVPTGDISEALAWVATAKETGLFNQGQALGVRDSGEQNLDTLEAQLAEAEKSGNIMAVLSLKRQIDERGK